MTGRRLHDKYCDSLKATQKRHWDFKYNRYHTDNAYSTESAWPFLTDQQKRFWNDMAKRVTPQRRKTA